MKFPWSSFAASVAFLLTRVLAPPLNSSDWPVVLKVVSIGLLAVLVIRVDKLVATALAFGALGDFFLGVPRVGNVDAKKLFLFGLGSFLAGHLVYIVVFRRYRAGADSPGQSRGTRGARSVAIASILVALVCVLELLRNSLGLLLVPVLAYAIVLAGMAISAQLAELGNSLAAIGALCFVASDAMLALSKFRGSFPGSGPLIWITYYLAQLLIFLGVARRASEIS